MRGRKPIPNRLKRLRGNPGKRPLSAEPSFPAGVPSAPKWLSPEAKKEWRRVAKLLEAARLITLADRPTLTAYCVAWDELREATEMLKDGRTFAAGEQMKPHPAVAMQRSAMQQLAKFAALFGFSPADRTRVHPLPTADGERDDFNDFLAGAATAN